MTVSECMYLDKHLTLSKTQIQYPLLRFAEVLNLLNTFEILVMGKYWNIISFSNLFYTILTTRLIQSCRRVNIPAQFCLTWSPILISWLCSKHLFCKHNCVELKITHLKGRWSLFKIQGFNTTWQVNVYIQIFPFKECRIFPLP